MENDTIGKFTDRSKVYIDSNYMLYPRAKNTVYFTQSRYSMRNTIKIVMQNNHKQSEK